MKQPQRLSLQSMFDTLCAENIPSDKFYFKNGLGMASM